MKAMFTDTRACHVGPGDDLNGKNVPARAHAPTRCYSRSTLRVYTTVPCSEIVFMFIVSKDMREPTPASIALKVWLVLEPGATLVCTRLVLHPQRGSPDSGGLRVLQFKCLHLAKCEPLMGIHDAS